MPKTNHEWNWKGASKRFHELIQSSSAMRKENAVLKRKVTALEKKVLKYEELLIDIRAAVNTVKRTRRKHPKPTVEEKPAEAPKGGGSDEPVGQPQA